MREAIVQYLPWFISALTVYCMYLAGNKNHLTWPLSIINQALWLAYILAAGAWGLLPMNAALWVIFIRNYFKWR